MASDSVVLSPECVGKFKREAPADALIDTGAFSMYTATGVDVATPATLSAMLAVENISTAQELDYVYQVGENVHLQSLPRGTLCQVSAAVGTYNVGDVLEIGANGWVKALVTAGAGVAVIPYLSQDSTPEDGESLIVELL
jgi:hypothetical protein